MFDSMKNPFDTDGKPKPALTKSLDTILRIQRPLVVSMVMRVRERHPEESPAQIAKRLETIYLRDITIGGGAVGASAFIPGVGTATSVGLSALAVGGYLERTALYVQALAELHGVHVDNPEAARAMVMGIMLGDDGAVLMSTLMSQTGKAAGISNKWGLMMGKDSQKFFSVERTIRNMFVKRFLTRQSGALLGRALPFGIGAVVGGGANLALGRKVVEAAHEAFGEVPPMFPASLSFAERAPRFEDSVQAQQQAQKDSSIIQGEIAE
ncbi:di- and tripeptidase [Rothia sp. CCM 9418]|uniref:di- and tripeptidase n=1 Tax=Rothia sp. CCM 9418 TaxID=3402661 RepID=UPI003AEED805